MIAVLLGLALSLAELSGTVLDPSGQPVANATVVVVGLNTTPFSTRTDRTGQFRLGPIPEGRFDITVSAPGLIGEARGVAVTASDEPAIEITMRVSAISETLIVSASQMDQPLSRVADTVTVIDGLEIDTRQLSFLAEALASVPGFTIARNGGPGTLTSVFPRGGESDFTLVLVDGIRANSFGGGLDLSQVPLGDVERIEVVRGPQSALFGSDAIGGVVQIVTKTGGTPSATGRVESGSRSTRRVAAATTGEIEGWKWQAGADYFGDDGFTGIAPANGERVSNDDAQERQAWVGGGHRWLSGTDLQGAFRYVDTDRGAPGAFGSDPAHRFFGVDRTARGSTERRSVGVRLLQPWGVGASRVRQRVEFDTADFDFSFLSAFPSTSEMRRTHARVQTDAVLNGGFSVSGGLEWLREQAANTFITSGPVKRRILGTFGEVRWDGHERLMLQAGLRRDVGTTNPKIAASWLVAGAASERSWTRLRASAGTGIRPPDAFELTFTDNPALKPERSRSFEIGATQALANGAVTLDATTFFNEYDDLIISVGRLTDISRYRTDNISNARSRGVELSAAWRSGVSTQLRGTYTFLDAEILAVDRTNQAPTPYSVGDRLLRRPRHQGSLDFIWARDRASAFASVVARGVTLDAEPAFGPSGGLFENGGRAVADLGGSFRIVRGVEIYARVLNLFDKAYEEVLGYPAPGRTAFAGVRLASRR